MKIAIAKSMSFRLSGEALKRLHQRGCKYMELAEGNINDYPVDLRDGYFCKVETPMTLDEWSDKIYFDGKFYTYPSFAFEEKERMFRFDSDLIAVVEELGDAAGDVGIVDVPDDVEWDITWADCGGEFVEEAHRTWVVGEEK